MINPFSVVLERTAPTPVKGAKAADVENVSCNMGGEQQRSDLDAALKSPVAKSVFRVETPSTANRTNRSNSMRKMESPLPQKIAVGGGRTRSISATTAPTTTTPAKGGSSTNITTPHKAGGVRTSYVPNSASAHKTNINKGSATPGGTPGGFGRGRSIRDTPVSTSKSAAVSARATTTTKVKPATTTTPVVVTKPTTSKRVVGCVEVKTLDSALRESLSGYTDTLQGKSDSEVAMLKDAEKKRRESVNKLRNRHSILHGDGAAAGLKVTEDEGQTIEQEARRQSVVVLNEFKQLVEAAENEVSEGGRRAEAAVAAEKEEEASSFKERGSDGARRESMALDQALIRQMLPRKVCVPLRQGKKVPPEAFQGVSIFFSDVVGFTTISSEVEPIKVHELLNTLFTVMDYCTAMFPLYKVETIGDAYMVAGGLPEPNENNAQDLADFALLVSAAVAACVKSPIDGSPIMIRMGCHTGDVMAGVVGTLMPRYCLFGDTVNTASRMESNGSPGQIHCSDDFAAELRGKGRHVLEERGEIEIKGKGVMRTHWLRGPSSVNDVSSSSAVEQVIADVRDLLAERESFGEEGGA